MPVKLSIFPLDNSPGYLVGRLSVEMSAVLHRTFQAHGFDVTTEQWIVLSRLWEQDGLHQSQVAERTGKDRHNIARILALLERRRLISRRPDPGDKRRKRVYLTARGRAMQARLTPLAVELLHRVCRGLSQKDLDDLFRVGRRMLNNLKVLQKSS
jgi:DNA-binding MarR family transcriptional regulator